MTDNHSHKITTFARGIAAASLSVGIAGACLAPIHPTVASSSNPSPLMMTKVGLVNQSNKLIQSDLSLLAALPQTNSFSGVYLASSFSFFNSF